MIDWSRVRVVPLVHDGQFEAPLKSEWEGLQPIRFGAAAIGLLIALYWLPSQSVFRPSGGSMTARVIAVTAIVLVIWVAVCCVGIMMAPVRQRHVATIVWVIVFLIGAALIASTL